MLDAIALIVILSLSIGSMIVSYMDEKRTKLRENKQNAICNLLDLLYALGIESAGDAPTNAYIVRMIWRKDR